MKNIFYNIPIAFLFLLFACNNKTENTPKEEVFLNNEPIVETPVVAVTEPFQFQTGDIIFQTSQSDQSKAIQLATKSEYSHVGIIMQNNAGEFFVLEAFKTVDKAPIQAWTARGDNGHYVVKRLINKDVLDSDNTKNLRKAAKNFKGKKYDPYFNWSDDEIYCSELVWKIYKQALNIELGEKQKMGDLDLSDPIVKEKLAQRYGSKIPLEEEVITPAAIFNSSLLEKVFEN